MPLMGPSEGQIMAIDSASQNKLNTIKEFNEIWPNFEKLALGSLESHLGGYPL